MRFILEGERAWCGASQFYTALKNLGISAELYELQLPYILSGEELDFYLDSLENDLRQVNRNQDAYWYVKQICSKLREWTEKGFVIHVRA